MEVYIGNVDYGHLEEPYFRVADNIFELMKGFTFTENNNPLADGFLSNQLYKKWNENFWRVRE